MPLRHVVGNGQSYDFDVSEGAETGESNKWLAGYSERTVKLRIRVDTKAATKQAKRSLMFFRRVISDLQPFFATIGYHRMEMIVNRQFSTRGLGRWAPPAATTIIRRKFFTGSYTQMIDTGDLRSKLLSNIKASKNAVRIRLNDKKARIQHMGGTVHIKGVKAKSRVPSNALSGTPSVTLLNPAFPIFKTQVESQWGKKYKAVAGGYVIYRTSQKAHDVKIPARSLFDFTNADADEIGEKLADHIMNRTAVGW